jgi:hypothetical protein
MDDNRVAPSEITVRDGHLTIKLGQLKDGWYAIVESDIEGKIFEGRITELSELLAGHPFSNASAQRPEDNPA